MRHVGGNDIALIPLACPLLSIRKDLEKDVSGGDLLVVVLAWDTVAVHFPISLPKFSQEQILWEDG